MALLPSRYQKKSFLEKYISIQDPLLYLIESQNTNLARFYLVRLDKGIFNCRNTSTSCDKSRSPKIASLIGPFLDQSSSMLVISRFSKLINEENDLWSELRGFNSGTISSIEFWGRCFWKSLAITMLCSMWKSVHFSYTARKKIQGASSWSTYTVHRGRHLSRLQVQRWKFFPKAWHLNN
jgi:hypothetical protein